MQGRGALGAPSRTAQPQPYESTATTPGRVGVAAHRSGAAEAHRRDEAARHRRVAVGAVHLVRRQPGRRWRRPTMVRRDNGARRRISARGHRSTWSCSAITRSDRGVGRQRSAIGHRKRLRGEKRGRGSKGRHRGGGSDRGRRDGGGGGGGPDGGDAGAAVPDVSRAAGASPASLHERRRALAAAP